MERPQQLAQVDISKHWPLVSLFGITFQPYDLPQLLALINQHVVERQAATIVSGNVHAFNLTYRTPWLRRYFQEATAVRIDGAGVRFGARLLGSATPKRMTWADFAWDLAAFCVQQEHSLYLLGGRPGIVQQAAARLIEHHPQLQVVGCGDGYFEKAAGCTENEAVITAINQANPDILIVGFGMPLQEQWLLENRDAIQVPVVLTGGAVFDYIAGNLKRAPRWMTANGLEWLGRLLIEPQRLWRRYLVGNPLFLFRVLKQRFTHAITYSRPAKD